MIPTLQQLQSMLGDSNVGAFLRVIREGESSQDDSAYRRRYHPTTVTYFDDLSKHPRIFETTPNGKRSSAAGAFQFTATTWDYICQKYGLEDNFSPYQQELHAVANLWDCGAIEPILAGNFDYALKAAKPQWASLPGEETEQTNDGHDHTYTFAEARAVWNQYGGGERVMTSRVPAPITETDPDGDGRPGVTARPEDVARIQGDTRMEPLSIISIFGPIIANLIPQLGKLFVNPEDAKQQRNLDAINLVLDAFTRSALGNPQASGQNVAQVASAVEAVRTDPILKAAVTKDVLTTPGVMEILEVGGGVAKAREFDAATMAAEKPFYKASAVFWVSMTLLPLCYWLVGSLIVGGVEVPEDSPWLAKLFINLFGTAWNGESRSGGFNLVIGLVLGGICGVYYGISVTQARSQASNPERIG